MKHCTRSRLRKQEKRRRLRMESLENRICLAASLGWDGPGQGSASLSYYIGDVPANVGLEQAEVESAIETALDAWASVADITFTPTTLARQSDSLDINFTSIDGSGGILAQAYLPDDVNRGRLAGDIEFDLADPWEIGNDNGRAAFDLVYVAAHEIGHALGLDHLNVVGSVLRPSVSPNQVFTALSTADENELLEIYAAASADSDAVDPVVVEPDTGGGDIAAPEDEATEPNAEDTNGSDDDVTDDDEETRRRSGRRGRFGGFGHRGRGGTLSNGELGREVLLAELSHHNTENPADVNVDGFVTSLDALTIINDLNKKGPRGLDFGEGESGTYFSMLDVNADNNVTSLDVLMVINDVNDSSAVAIVVENPTPESDPVSTDTPTNEGTATKDPTTESQESSEDDATMDDETSIVDDLTETDEMEVEDETAETDTDNELDDDDQLEDHDDKCHDRDHEDDDDSDVEDSDDEDVDENETEEDDPEMDDEQDSDGEDEDPVAEDPDTEEPDGGDPTAGDDGGDITPDPVDPVVMTDMGDPTIAALTADETDTETNVIQDETPADDLSADGESEVATESDTLDDMEDESDDVDDEDNGEDDEDDESMIDEGGLEEEHEGCHGGRRDPFAEYDTNADGLLTVDEVPERFWEHIMAADTDADGGISAAELEAIAMEHHRRDPIAKFDANADGALTVDEVPERVWEKVSQADADQDGMVTEAELAAALPAAGEGPAPDRRLHGGHRWHRYRS